MRLTCTVFLVYRHDFVVVETIDFYEDEEAELPPPMSLRDVQVRQCTPSPAGSSHLQGALSCYYLRSVCGAQWGRVTYSQVGPLTSVVIVQALNKAVPFGEEAEEEEEAAGGEKDEADVEVRMRQHANSVAFITFTSVACMGLPSTNQ